MRPARPHLFSAALALVLCAGALHARQPEQDPPPSAPPAPTAPAPEASAAAPADPRIASLQSARARFLDAEGNPTDEEALARLDEAIARLRALPQLREQAAALDAEAQSAPQQTAALQAEFDAPAPEPETLLPEPGADLAALESAQRTLDERLQAMRTRLENIGRQRVDRAARTEAIPAELAAALARLDDATERLAELGPAGAEPNDGVSTQRLIAESDREHAAATIDKLEAERRFLKAVGPRRDARARLAEREAATLESARQLLATRVAAARRTDAARQRTQTQRAAGDVPPELEPLSAEAIAFSEENTELVARLNTTEKELADTRALAQQIATRDTQIRARATGAHAGAQIGSLLQRAQETLPNADRLAAESSRLAREAGSLDDRAFELETRLDELPTTDADIRAYLRRSLRIESPTEAQVSAARSLFELQRQAIRELRQTLIGPDRVVAQLQELAAAKSDLAVRVELLNEFVSARILWVRADPPITKVSMRSAFHGFDPLVDREQWGGLWTTLASRSALVVSSAVAAPVLLFVLLFASSRARRGIRRIDEALTKPETDRVRLTVAALVLVAIRAAVLPVMLVIASEFFATLAAPERPLATWLQVGLRAMALPIFAGGYLARICRPSGVGQTHFRWPQGSCASVRRHLRWYVALIAATVFVITGARAAGGLDGASLARTLAPIALLATAAFFGALLRPGGPLMRNAVNNALWTGWRWVWPVCVVAIVGAFLTLTVLSLLGWTFSVRVLARSLIYTAMLVAVMVLVRAVLLRWLGLEHRRLAMERHRKIMEAFAKEREKASTAGEEEAMVAPPPPPPEIDLRSIQRQTRQLLNLGLWALGIAIVLPIWNDVFPAVAGVDSIRLFPLTAGPDETTAALRESGRYVLSLADLLSAIVIAVVGVIVIRNIPALLDGFVLSRTGLDIGARYAVTTLTRYALVGAVVLAFLAAIGFSGSSLGWAVAGLSVGLGLGLQDFVGNLVAGLSLLFERTVRPGDWITVGNVEGIVKSLSIRATVLTDFDRRDVVIPNRNLFSDVVINYTRSDMTGRAMIKVGVAYGSDTRLVERLLREAITSHELVEDVILTFDLFGDNSLNFTARTYLKDVSQRLGTVNELHHRITKAFREHGIEISFPQRDLHIRDGALEVRLIEPRSTAT